MKFTIRRVPGPGVSDGERAGEQGISGRGVWHDITGENPGPGYRAASSPGGEPPVRQEKRLTPMIRIFLKSVAGHNKSTMKILFCNHRAFGKIPGTAYECTDTFIHHPASPFTMASSDSTGLYIFGFIVLAIIGIVAYSYLHARVTKDRRRQLIAAFKTNPVIAKGAPILVQGKAIAPDLILPSTGEHVAFYSMFVFSRESAITGSRSTARIRINGIPLGSDGQTIGGVEGVMFYETSGDFVVASGGAQYTVQASGTFAYFKTGADLVSGLVAGQITAAGLPESFFQDTMNIRIAEPALAMLCGFDAPIVTRHSHRYSGSGGRRTTTDRTTVSVVTATSRIDARIHTFVSGISLPDGVQALIAKRGIELPEKEEIIVVETFIPLYHDVYVFGTFDGNGTIGYTDSTTQLSVSYTDPERD